MLVLIAPRLPGIIGPCVQQVDKFIPVSPKRGLESFVSNSSECIALKLYGRQNGGASICVLV